MSPAQKTQTNEDAQALGSGLATGRPRKPEGRRQRRRWRRQRLPRAWPGSARGERMTASRSASPGPAGRAARSRRRRRARPRSQSAGGSLHSRGSAAWEGMAVCARRTGPNPRAAAAAEAGGRGVQSGDGPSGRRGHSASWSVFPPPGLRARALGGRRCAPTRVCPLYTGMLLTYWPGRRLEPWLMPQKTPRPPPDTRTAVRPLGRGRAGRLGKGRKRGKPPSLMLISRLPGS